MIPFLSLLVRFILSSIPNDEWEVIKTDIRGNMLPMKDWSIAGHVNKTIFVFNHEGFFVF
jgi:hypothetical protein